LPELAGTSYIATHGGHIVYVDLATKKVKRIPVETIAGDISKGADAVTVSPDGKTLYYASLSGYVYTIDVATRKVIRGPTKIGNKFCGSPWFNGKIYLGDMKDSNVYVYDPATDSLADIIEVGAKSTCGVVITKDGKYMYTADMPGGFVQVIDMATKKVIGKIEGVGEFIHRAELTPDDAELWVTNAAEKKAGEPYALPKVVGPGGDPMVKAVEGATAGVTIIDVATNTIKERIVTEGFNPHDVEFSPDGVYALVVARNYVDDSAILVYDAAKRELLETISLCKDCHETNDVEITIDGGAPNPCGISTDWSAYKPAAKPYVGC
jgi:YVTN family beta-propeller protein